MITTPSRSNLARLRRSADLRCRYAKAAADAWMALLLYVTILEQCERYAPYIRLPLEVNESALQNCEYKAVRECLKPVVKVQQKLKKLGKEIESWTRREIEAHEAYMNMTIIVEMQELLAS